MEPVSDSAGQPSESDEVMANDRLPMGNKAAGNRLDDPRRCTRENPRVGDLAEGLLRGLDRGELEPAWNQTGQPTSQARRSNSRVVARTVRISSVRVASDRRGAGRRPPPS